MYLGFGDQCGSRQRGRPQRRHRSQHFRVRIVRVVCVFHPIRLNRRFGGFSAIGNSRCFGCRHDSRQAIQAVQPPFVGDQALRFMLGRQSGQARAHGKQPLTGISAAVTSIIKARAHQSKGPHQADTDLPDPQPKQVCQQFVIEIVPDTQQEGRACRGIELGQQLLDRMTVINFGQVATSRQLCPQHGAPEQLRPTVGHGLAQRQRIAGQAIIQPAVDGIALRTETAGKPARMAQGQTQEVALWIVNLGLGVDRGRRRACHQARSRGVREWSPS